jgi:uncharacterized protein YecT (DUF1311 family)
MKYLIITVSLLFSSFDIFSQITFTKDTSLIEKQYVSDLSKALSNHDDIQAAHTYYDSYDKLLNKIYRFLLAKLNPSDKVTFISAQKKWIVFRDLEFKNIELLFSSHDYFGGGSMTYSMIIYAKAKWLKNRCIQLSDLIRYASIN